MKTTAAISFTFPRWKAHLLISLLSADGEGGFDDADIREAETFIRENNLLSFVEAEDTEDQQVKCTFLTGYGNSKLYTYVLIGKKVVEQFNSFGLLPYMTGSNDDENFYFFRSFASAAERDAYLSGLNDGNISENHVVIEHAEMLLNQWWSQTATELKDAFSVNAKDNRAFWEQLPFADKKNIYCWYIIKTHGIPVSEDDLSSFLLEMASSLSDLSLSLKHGKPVEAMCDEDGSFLEEYQDEFNNIFDEIEDVIMSCKYCITP